MMTFEQFKCEAERLGLKATHNTYDLKGYKGIWWDICATGDTKGLAILIAPHRDGWSYCGEVESGTPAEALREAARLMRGDVAGELRKWLEETTTACGTAKRGRQCIRCGHLREVIDKLNELEGKP